MKFLRHCEMVVQISNHCSDNIRNTHPAISSGSMGFVMVRRIRYEETVRQGEFRITIQICVRKTTRFRQEITRPHATPSRSRTHFVTEVEPRFIVFVMLPAGFTLGLGRYHQHRSPSSSVCSPVDTRRTIAFSSSLAGLGKILPSHWQVDWSRLYHSTHRNLHAVSETSWSSSATQEGTSLHYSTLSFTLASATSVFV